MTEPAATIPGPASALQHRPEARCGLRGGKKRLHRILDNPRLDRAGSPGLVRLIAGWRGGGLWSVLLDGPQAGWLAGPPGPDPAKPSAPFTPS